MILKRRWTPAYAGVTAVQPSSFRRRPESRVFVGLLLFVHSTFAQDFSALDAAAGQALFESNWIMAPASTTSTDGLGPYYNARACAVCHPRGGSGDNTLGSMNLVVDDPGYGALVQLRALPGLPPEAHAELAYVVVDTVTLSDGATIALSKPNLVLSAWQHGELASISSLRRAPSLAGLGLLEQVPLAALQALADPDDRNGDGISGRVAAGGGRFGWKATATTLREQSARALSLDLGLGTTLFPSASGDCTPTQSLCIDAARAVTGDEVEAPDTVLDLLVTYLRSLPPPGTEPASGEGSELFATLGCPACHAPQLQANGQALHPFTDLLLHDLGPGLAAATGDPFATAAEWRTAPLWGLGQKPYFLHDGRATTLDEAVLWHAGEATASAGAYRDLNGAQRAVLHQWLLRL